MKKVFAFTTSAIMAMSMVSCGNQTDSLQSKVDSLQTALDQRDADYGQLNEFLTVIASSLDSISAQESDIFNPSKESPAPNQEQIKKDLAAFQQTLKNQRERITDLEKALQNSNGNVSKLKGIVSTLKAQLEEKEAQIAALQEELEGKNITIHELNTRVNTLTLKNTNQQNIISTQNNVIEQQDNIINEGFIRIASKKELKNAGLLSTSFLKKAKVDVSNIDRSQFRAIDTRLISEVEINTKNPKILTQMPADSYRLDKENGKTILRITNPTRFWSVSKFLIIQTD